MNRGRLPRFHSFLLALALGGLALAGRPAGDGWEPVAAGISYREFELPGPTRAYVAVMDRDAPRVTIETSIAQGRLSGGVETVSDMAQRYNGALNTWGEGWGGRNRVVVAINGSFFDLETGVPQTGMIQSGWYVKQFDNLGGGSGFAWKQDGTAFVGECIFNDPGQQSVVFLGSGQRMEVDGVNQRRRKNQLVVYTSQFDKQTLTNDNGAEVLVELDGPLAPQPSGGSVVGTIRQIRDLHGSTPIPFDHIVLSAHGAARDELLANARLGGLVGIALRPVHLDDDCRTQIGPDWAGVYASLGGSFNFLKDGRIRDFDDDAGATSRHPRTAICFNDSDLFFVVVDGREEGVSIGMTIHELAEFCRDTLGATWGLNQDGGGSSTMWVNGEVVNRPSDGAERLVANGYMMVVVQPERTSTAFAPGDRVAAARAMNVWLGPGTNYGALTSVPKGESGTVLSPLSGVNGVYAKGSYWWKVGFARSAGWVREGNLDRVGPPRLQAEAEPGDSRVLPWEWILRFFGVLPPGEPSPP